LTITETVNDVTYSHNYITAKDMGGPNFVKVKIIYINNTQV